MFSKVSYFEYTQIYYNIHYTNRGVFFILYYTTQIPFICSKFLIKFLNFKRRNVNTLYYILLK